MIARKYHYDFIYIFSDKGLLIKQVETGKTFFQALEKKDSIHYTYEEIEPKDKTKKE